MTGQAAPRVSLIVPVYQVAEHVEAAIASVLAQRFGDFEVIVVDDGSTDGSGDLARRAAGGDPRFVFLTQENAGLSAARNAGLDRARGELVGFLDSDDRLAPGYLERLVAALDDTGADWVSCGITFCPAGGRPWAHSAIHGDWKIPEGARPERHDLGDWREVARHFPSAWNKLYRRRLLQGLRFDEGMNYEDHAFHWRYAARTDHLVRLPEPLYLSTQGRAGQITRDGSDRVFEQFAVLDILETVSGGQRGGQGGGQGGARGGARPDGPPDKTGRDVALARIATRLSFERADVIGDRDRRARFLARARDWLLARGLAPDDSLGVPAYWLELLEGDARTVPVSVIVPTNGDIAALRGTLTSLAAQTLTEAEILVLPDRRACPGDSAAHRAILALAADLPGVSVLAGGAGGADGGADGVAGARNAGLAAARGGAVVFLDAGDSLPPRALAAWHNRLRRAGADLGWATMRMGGAARPHCGLHDRDGIAAARLEDARGCVPTPADGLVLHGHPSAKIFDRAFLRDNGLTFPPGPLSSTHMMLAAVLAARRMVHVAGFPAGIATRPACRTQWRRPTPPDDLHAALAAMAADPRLAALPEGWQGRLWARVLWEKLNHADFPSPEAQAAFVARARQVSADRPPPGGAAGLDPYIGPRIRRLVGLPE